MLTIAIERGARFKMFRAYRTYKSTKYLPRYKYVCTLQPTGMYCTCMYVTGTRPTFGINLSAQTSDCEWRTPAVTNHKTFFRPFWLRLPIILKDTISTLLV